MCSNFIFTVPTVAVFRMDASLVNVFVSELFKFKTGGQCETVDEMPKPQPVKTEDKDSLPTMTSEELTQIQDQMRKVMMVFFSLNISGSDRLCSMFCVLMLNYSAVCLYNIKYIFYVHIHFIIIK